MKGHDMSNEKKLCKVHYVGTFDDGEVFDSSRLRDEPLEFICMNGQMIPGFDEAVMNMEVGQIIDVHLEPKDAYGEHDESLVQKVEQSKVPNGENLPVGQTIYMQNQTGIFPVQVVSIEDGIVTFDLNDPMAGKALNFNIELLEVSDPE